MARHALFGLALLALVAFAHATDVLDIDVEELEVGIDSRGRELAAKPPAKLKYTNKEVFSKLTKAVGLIQDGQAKMKIPAALVTNLVNTAGAFKNAIALIQSKQRDVARTQIVNGIATIDGTLLQVKGPVNVLGKRYLRTARRVAALALASLDGHSKHKK